MKDDPWILVLDVRVLRRKCADHNDHMVQGLRYHYQWLHPDVHVSLLSLDFTHSECNHS